MQTRTKFVVIFLLLVCGCFGLCRAIECKVNATDPSKCAYTITVDPSGQGDVVAVQAAVDSVHPQNDQWVRIHVNPGIYKEKVNIPNNKECIFLEGSGYHQTTIVFDQHGQTDTSPTFAVSAGNFVAKGITFQNSYNRPSIGGLNDEIAPAVAAEIIGDKSAFHECAFLGLQDTVWDVQGRHYFNSCHIEGAIDFIWGAGQSSYEDCSINVTAGLLQENANTGYITAQGRSSAEDPSGFVFIKGRVFGSGQTFLGRAYGPYSRVIYVGTALDEAVVPQGWDAWTYVGHEGNFTYAEDGCQGLGANTSGRVRWEKKLGGEELKYYSRRNFVDQDEWIGKQP